MRVVLITIFYALFINILLKLENYALIIEEPPSRKIYTFVMYFYVVPGMTIHMKS